MRIPFGITNGPVEFHCFMKNCLDGYRDKICAPYLDHVIVYAKTKFMNMLRICGKFFIDFVQKISNSDQEMQLVSERGHIPRPYSIRRGVQN